MLKYIFLFLIFLPIIDAKENNVSAGVLLNRSVSFGSKSSDQTIGMAIGNLSYERKIKRIQDNLLFSIGAAIDVPKSSKDPLYGFLLYGKIHYFISEKIFFSGKSGITSFIHNKYPHDSNLLLNISPGLGFTVGDAVFEASYNVNLKSGTAGNLLSYEFLQLSIGLNF